SYLALQKQLNGKKVDKIDGFTPAQRFFIGYARIWGQNITPEEEVRLTKIDTHSLGNNRVNQALKNIDAFYEAFNVQPGDPMYIAPEERVLVW
ncbi:M13-type metalloendopeptidase, partial [Porphyromonas uenonis]